MIRSILSLMFVLIIGIAMSGCATWHGAKKDTSKVWDVVTS